MIHQTVIDLLTSFSEVTDLIGKNTEYEATADQYAIRPGQLDERDPYPGIVITVPNQDHDPDLADDQALVKADVEVSCVSFDLAQAWALRHAAAFNGGDPNDPDRATGLAGHKDAASGLWSISLTNDTEDAVEVDDGSDRLLWIVSSTYSIEYEEGI